MTHVHDVTVTLTNDFWLPQSKQFILDPQVTIWAEFEEIHTMNLWYISSQGLDEGEMN